MSAAPQAALGVAIALLVLAACARAAIVADVRDASARRLAERYAEPLANWCAIVVVVYLLAVTAAGEATVVTIGLGFLLGGGLAAVVRLLTRVGGAAPRAGAASPPTVDDAAVPAASPRPAREAAGTLWSRRAT